MTFFFFKVKKKNHLLLKYIVASLACVESALPVIVLWREAAGLQVVRDVPVGEVLDDPLGEGQRLDLVCGHRVAQDGSAQVAQAGYRHRSLPEPDVTVSGSAMMGEVVSVPGDPSG